MKKTKKKDGGLLQRGKPTSPFLTEKCNVVYVLCGQKNGSKANQHMQRMVARASSYETSGGIYVSASSWQDAPTAPPVTYNG